MSGSKPAPRQRSRQVALQVLYAADLISAGSDARARRESLGLVEADASNEAHATDADSEVRPLGAQESRPRVDAEAVFERVAQNFDLPEGARAFSKELVCGILAEREALDALITVHARNWRLERMAAVDRNVLRLAAYELTHTDTPAPIILDEAIELTHRFGSDRSPAFVNGVLDAIAREVREEVWEPRATDASVPERSAPDADPADPAPDADESADLEEQP